jgi:hypothetical protein
VSLAQRGLRELKGLLVSQAPQDQLAPKDLLESQERRGLPVRRVRLVRLVLLVLLVRRGPQDQSALRGRPE